MSRGGALFDRLPAAVMAVGLAAVLASGCGGDDDGPGERRSGNPADASFVTEVLSNHQAAIKLAGAARRHGEHSEIRQMAVDMVEAGRAEVTGLEAVRRELARAAINAPRGTAQRPTGQISSDARPFDLAFVDAMIANSERAIRLARGQLDRGSHARLRAIARDILTRHSREVSDLRNFRARWYGNAQPRERDGRAGPGSGPRRALPQGKRSAEIRGPRRRARDHSPDMRRDTRPMS